VTLQAAADAFLDHHDLARSTRRVYQASLTSLVAGLGPDESDGRSLQWVISVAGHTSVKRAAGVLEGRWLSLRMSPASGYRALLRVP
jgi:hypothetical protein